MHPTDEPMVGPSDLQPDACFEAQEIKLIRYDTGLKEVKFPLEEHNFTKDEELDQNRHWQEDMNSIKSKNLISE